MHAIRLYALALAAAILLSTSALAQPVPVEHFSRSSQFADVRISPDGKHLAAVTRHEGRRSLAFMKTDTLDPVGALRFQSSEEVGSFWWVNNERLVIEVNHIVGYLDYPLYRGELFAVNLDGSKKMMIFGYRAGDGRADTKIKKAKPTRAGARVIDLLPNKPKKVLITTTSWHGGKRAHAKVEELDVYTGKARTLTRVPVLDASVITDQNGKPRFAIGSNDKGKTEVYYREESGGDWQLFGKVPKGEIIPYTFSRDNQSVYVLDNSTHSVKGVYRYDLKTKTKKKIYLNKRVDPSDSFYTADGRSIYAISLDPDFPSYALVTKGVPEAALLKELLGSFQGSRINITSMSRDGHLAIVYTGSDREPGSFYLFDTQKKTVRYLVGVRPWIKPEQMATVEPIEVKTRDGMTLHGYVTLPNGTEPKNLPMVVLPHGGPHGPRDYWRFDPEAQLLASRGMAVLQINFRGSGGYGREFQESGYRHWGSKIQYDIIDATRAMVASGLADEKRLCIYGGSFGAYSALQSSILEPDLFQCAIGMAGVYDLAGLYDEGDTQKLRRGRAVLKRYIGEDLEELKEFSPIHRLDELKAPVLIIHGGEDERTPISQAESLKKGLEERNREVGWLIMEQEGHGFYNPEHRHKAYEAMLAFLKKHLKL